MKKVWDFLRRRRWALLFVLACLIGGGAYYFYARQSTPTVQYAVVQTVGKGTVSSGIQTTGEIVAAHKLDLDVYKQTQRIETVNVVNGGHVDKGDVILSFDKSGAYANVGASQVKVVQAELDLKNNEANVTDPNTTIRSRESEIGSLEAAIAQAEKDKMRAYEDFMNANLTAEPGKSSVEDKQRPTISGLYIGKQQGEYRIETYRSAAESGFSYHVTGLEQGTLSVLTNTATAVGTRGLKITFPDDIASGDTWVIAVPNTYSPKYVQSKADYDKKIINLNATIESDRVSIANKKEELKDLVQTDTASYRDLTVSKSEADLAQARQELTQYYDVVKEQDIVAPFSGTVEGFENVVVGATPTRDTNDPISFGTLISDEFLVKFALGATDIAKVKVGQKVLVTITSFPTMQPLEAAITEISSLPESEDVAQYGVQALITIPEAANVSLREGLLADVEIVQQEVAGVVRVPLSAITYENGQAQVQVIGTLTDTEREQLASAGVLSSQTGSFPSYPANVKLGVVGAFYAEVTDGLSEGARIIASKTDSKTAVVQQQGPGQPPRQNTNGTGNSTSGSGSTNRPTTGGTTSR